jgi:hypothetical protein
MGLGDFLEDLGDLFGAGYESEAERQEREREEAVARKRKKYADLQQDFAREFDNYLRTKSPASQARMNALNQSLVDFLHDQYGYSNYREARIEVARGLNVVKAEILEKFENEKRDKHKRHRESEKLVDKSSSRMRLRPYAGERLELSGVVEKIEFANHEGQMQAIIKKVEVDTENGPIRYDHLNFFVSDSVGDEMLQKIGERIHFRGKVTLYDRGEHSTKKGSSEKSYGFTGIQIKEPVKKDVSAEMTTRPGRRQQIENLKNQEVTKKETLPFSVGQTVRFSAVVDRFDGQTVELSKVDFEGNADRINKLSVSMKSSVSVIGIFSTVGNGNVQVKMKLAAIRHDRVQFQGVVADDNGKKVIHDAIAQFS